MKFKFRGKTYKVVEGGGLWWAMEIIPALAVTVTAILAIYLWAGIGQTL